MTHKNLPQKSCLRLSRKWTLIEIKCCVTQINLAPNGHEEGEHELRKLVIHSLRLCLSAASSHNIGAGRIWAISGRPDVCCGEQCSPHMSGFLHLTVSSNRNL